MTENKEKFELAAKEGLINIVQLNSSSHISHILINGVDVSQGIEYIKIELEAGKCPAISFEREPAFSDIDKSISKAVASNLYKAIHSLFNAQEYTPEELKEIEKFINSIREV